MKKLLITTALAAITALCANHATAQTPAQSPAGNDTLKVRITGIRSAEGILLVALGDDTKPTGMVATMAPATGETVECTLIGNIDPTADIHAFHDTNGNFTLDMRDGVPTEGCASGPVVTDENGTAVINLKYFD